MNDDSLRKHLVELMRGHGAHVDFEKAIAGLPVKLRGAKPPKHAFTPWQLLEHMRLAQWDILEFCRNAEYESPDWPEGYWPESNAPAPAKAWATSVAAFRRDRADMEAMVTDPANDLFARIPHGTGQTLLREALLVADHNAYHTGQLVLVRRLLGAWKE